MNITQTRGNYPGDNTDNHVFTITDEHGTAADLYIDTEHQHIVNIEVRADRQGEGLARALYEHADQALGGIFHMPAWGCTPEGAAFAEAMGGETLDDETAAEWAGVDLEALGIAA